MIVEIKVRSEEEEAEKDWSFEFSGLARPLKPETYQIRAEFLECITFLVFSRDSEVACFP